METIDRSTASNSSTGARLAVLTGGIRALWASELPASATGREDLIIELLDLDLVVERLTIRTRCQNDWPQDDERTQSCAEQFVSLERRWHEAAASAAAVTGRGHGQTDLDRNNHQGAQQ